MFVSKWSIGTEDFAAPRSLRMQVSVNENGIDENIEFDALDAYAAHLYIAEEDGTPIAAGRMYPDGESICIDRIAVMHDYRGGAYFDLALRMLLFKAQQMPQKYIVAALGEGHFSLLARFGFAAMDDKLNCRIEREGIIWHSECKDNEQA